MDASIVSSRQKSRVSARRTDAATRTECGDRQRAIRRFVMEVRREVSPRFGENVSIELPD
jgi:hypothetical protein